MTMWYPFPWWLWFIAGACIASFLNVCISRLPVDENPLWGRSHCPACRHPIAWYDLVPILSWLYLCGRCRHCQAPISPRYLLVEILGGLGGVVIGWRFGLTPEAVLASFVVAVLLTGAFIDMEHLMVSDLLTWIPAIPVLLLWWWIRPAFLPEALLSAVGYFCLQFAIAVISNWWLRRHFPAPAPAVESGAAAAAVPGAGAAAAAEVTVKADAAAAGAGAAAEAAAAVTPDPAGSGGAAIVSTATDDPSSPETAAANRTAEAPQAAADAAEQSAADAPESTGADAPSAPQPSLPDAGTRSLLHPWGHHLLWTVLVVLALALLGERALWVLATVWGLGMLLISYQQQLQAQQAFVTVSEYVAQAQITGEKLEALGLGDACFAALAGAILGYPAFLALFLLGPVLHLFWYGIVLWRRVEVAPYLPALSLATLIVYFFASDVLQWLANWLLPLL